MSKFLLATIAGAGAGIVFLFLIAFSVILDCFFKASAVTILWHWFAVPLGLPSASWLHVYGILLLVRLFIPSTYVPNYTGVDKRSASIKFIEAVAPVILHPILAVAIGYVIKVLAGL